MKINSIMTLSSDIKTTKINELGIEEEHVLAYASATINRSTYQCVFNIQVFEHDEYEKYKDEINDGISDFFASLPTYARGTELTFFDTFKK